eukprot:scaffold250_cov298-Pavlova_lutheri.AAC.3
MSWVLRVGTQLELGPYRENQRRRRSLREKHVDDAPGNVDLVHPNEGETKFPGDGDRQKKRKDDGAREWWGWSGMVAHSSASRLCEGVPADAHTAQHTWSSMQNEGRRGWCRHAHFLHLPVSDWNGACLHHMVLQWYGKKDGSRIRCMLLREAGLDLL